MKRLFHVTLVLLAVGTVILMQPGVAAAADKIKVVATFSVIADMVTNVAGDLCRSDHHRRPRRRFRGI